MTAALEAFSREALTFDNKTRDVFSIGDGPGVVVLPEMPGITPEVARLAERVAGAGFTVFVPDLFGVPGKPFSNTYVARSMIKACVSKEFVAFARNKESPVTSWLGGLVAEAHLRCGGNIGVVGMCFTGGFALALAVDPVVKVAAMSQPALPLGPLPKSKRSIGVSEDELSSVKQRVAKDDVCVIGLRFTNDGFVPAERFERLRTELGDAFLGVEIDSSPGNVHGFGKDAHSVLTMEFNDDDGSPTKRAYDLIITHFEDRLRAE